MQLAYNAFRTGTNNHVAETLSNQRGRYISYLRRMGARNGEVDEVFDRAIYKILKTRNPLEPERAKGYFKTVLRTALIDYWKRDSNLKLGQDLSEDPKFPGIGSDLEYTRSGKDLPITIEDIDEAIPLIYPNPQSPRRQLYEDIVAGKSIIDITRERGLESRTGVDSQWTRTKEDIRIYFRNQED